MRPDTTTRRVRHLLLAAIAVLLCTSGLVAANASPASAAPKPAKVKGVKLKKPRVDGTTASFKVKWKRAARATSYKVQWRTPGGKPHKERTRKTTMTIKKLAQGTDYCVKVRAYNGKRKGKWSKTRCRTTATLAPVQPVWVEAQQVQGATVTLTFRWNEIAGATSYDFDYVKGQQPIQGHKNKKRVQVAAVGSGTAAVTIGGFEPRATYCFQVRPSGPKGVGAFGTAGCKYTEPTDRVGGPIQVNMMTWNVCANVCDGWAVREPLIKQRITQIQPDAVAIQEGPNVGYDGMEPLPGYVRACKAGDGNGAEWRNQTLFVRTAKYSVVNGSARGIRFPGYTHGGCWVEVIDNAAGANSRHLVLTSVHLAPPKDASDTERYSETYQFLEAIKAAYAGAPPQIVLTGDYNSTRNSSWDAPRELLNGAGYDDAFDVAERYNTLPYINSWNAWRNPAPQSWRWGEHVDRVFVTPGAKVTSWQMESPFAGSQQLSDHSPVRVTVLMP